VASDKLLIKGGTVVNAHSKEVADVYVENGIIVAVRSNIKVVDDVDVLDASGKYVMPGGIDPHTHLAMEFMGTETIDDFFSGQAAALAGGTTMHIDFIIPVNGSLEAGFKAYEKKAKKACMDYGFHMAVTKWDEDVSREMEIMVKDKGINSFKFFMAYKGSLMINDDLLLEGFKRCKTLGALAMVHAENGDAVFEGQKRMIELGITGPEGHALSRPPVLEGEATARAIRLASFVNTPLYIVHVMSIDAMEEIAKARKSGQKVIGEPVVSGLVLDDSGLWDPDFTTAAKYVMSPPIRASGHGRILQAALSTGVLQLVGTDHCVFNSTQKASGIDDFRKIPNGVNGIEERMHLVWDTMVESGQISVSDYVRVTSTECAKIFNIYPRKGAILAGSDADIIIFNPNSSFTISAKSHHSRTDTNVYDGRRVKGKVETTIAGGRVVWENDELKVEPGTGKYVEMPPFSHLFDGIDKVDAEYLSSLKAPVKRLKSTT
jgi:dihydropyrimidinase